MAKQVPDRYPSNRDSIGIELVGRSLPPPSGSQYRAYEVVTEQQNATLHWLVGGLYQLFPGTVHNVFRHPQVSEKTPTEAATARW